MDVLDVDLLTIAGHKLYAPKGIGVLFVRDGISLEPLLHGGSHENGMRGGTENTPYIVGLGHAAQLAAKCLDDSASQMAMLRDRLTEHLKAAIPGLIVNGEQVQRLPNTLSAIFPNVDAQELLGRIPELCVSTGAACHSDGSVTSATLDAELRCDLLETPHGDIETTETSNDDESGHGAEHHEEGGLKRVDPGRAAHAPERHIEKYHHADQERPYPLRNLTFGDLGECDAAPHHTDE